MLRHNTLVPEATQPSLGDLVVGPRFCAELSTQATVREFVYAFATYAEAIRDDRPAAKVLDDIRLILKQLAKDRNEEEDALGAERSDKLEEIVDKQTQWSTEVNFVVFRFGASRVPFFREQVQEVARTLEALVWVVALRIVSGFGATHADASSIRPVDGLDRPCNLRCVPHLPLREARASRAGIRSLWSGLDAVLSCRPLREAT